MSLLDNPYVAGTVAFVLGLAVGYWLLRRERKAVIWISPSVYPAVKI